LRQCTLQYPVTSLSRYWQRSGRMKVSSQPGFDPRLTASYVIAWRRDSIRLQTAWRSICIARRIAIASNNTFARSKR
jgi:hypothetical protein